VTLAVAMLAGVAVAAVEAGVAVRGLLATGTVTGREGFWLPR